MLKGWRASSTNLDGERQQHGHPPADDADLGLPAHDAPRHYSFAPLGSFDDTWQGAPSAGHNYVSGASTAPHDGHAGEIRGRAPKRLRAGRAYRDRNKQRRAESHRATQAARLPTRDGENS